MKIFLEHPNPDILDYFEQVVGWLNLEEKLDEINDEYFRTGKAFAHLNVLCDICDGTAMHLETNETCDHPNGTFEGVLVLNSDWVAASESGFAIIAHEELLKQAQENDPSIPDRVKDAINLTGQVELSNRTLVEIDSLAGSEFVEHIFQLIAEMQGFENPDFGPNNTEVNTHLFPKVIVQI